MGNGFATGIIGQLLGTSVPPEISHGEKNLLRRLITEEDEETGDQLTRFVPGGWWLDTEQLSAPLCFRLIRHSFISMDGEESGGVSYWRVNEMGRMAVEGKTLAEIEEATKR